MSVIVRMPSVLADSTHAVLTAWLIETGTHIAVGDAIAEIETDKAVVEYAAEVEGTIGRLLVEAGTDVTVGDPIAVVLAQGEDPSTATEDEVEVQVATSDDPPPARSTAMPPSPGRAGAPAEVAGAAPQVAAVTDTASRVFASPIARRVAAERGVDLADVAGTGPNGRIVRRDVEARAASSSARASSGLSSAASPDGFTDVPLTAMRRAIARRLTESMTTAPHFYLTSEVRVDKLLALRQDVNRVTSRKVSVNDLVVKAAALALIEVPAANAVWNGDSIRRFENADVGVAVAVSDGLLTPVLRAANTLGITELSARLAQLAERARAGGLRQHELEGGSFAVSNLGMFGVAQFSAILNPPQAGILAVSAAKATPLVGDDGQLTVGTVMTVTLSADHRVIDGAVAAAWSAAFTSKLEDPVSLLV